MPKVPRWRTLLDPRDPDYVDPAEREDDEVDPDDTMTADELAAAAAEAENRWRNEP